MIDAVLAKVFGTKNKREIKAIQPLIAAINDLEPAIQQLSDIDLAAKTIEFKEKLAQGAPVDDLLIEAFAVVREAGRRFLRMRHFNVQPIGGIVFDCGTTTECKMLVAIYPGLCGLECV
jgi:preprotein translocase subunit SecA